MKYTKNDWKNIFFVFAAGAIGWMLFNQIIGIMFAVIVYYLIYIKKVYK